VLQTLNFKLSHFIYEGKLLVLRWEGFFACLSLIKTAGNSGASAIASRERAKAA
jgi:hypothetical protein